MLEGENKQSSQKDKPVFYASTWEDLSLIIKYGASLSDILYTIEGKEFKDKEQIDI